MSYVTYSIGKCEKDKKYTVIKNLFHIVIIKNILDFPEGVHGLLGHVRHAGLVDQRQQPEHQLQRRALHLYPRLTLTTRYCI